MDNDRPDELSPAFHAAHKIRKDKSDYGDIKSYFPFGKYSYIHEINKKTKRLVNLTKTGKEPNFESIEDNLVDLINYASYYWEHIKEGKDAK